MLRSPRDHPPTARQRAPRGRPRQGGQPHQTLPELPGHTGAQTLRRSPCQPSDTEPATSKPELQFGFAVVQQRPGAAENQPAAHAHGAEEEQRPPGLQHPQSAGVQGTHAHVRTRKDPEEEQRQRRRRPSAADPQMAVQGAEGRKEESRGGGEEEAGGHYQATPWKKEMMSLPRRVSAPKQTIHFGRLLALMVVFFC